MFHGYIKDNLFFCYAKLKDGGDCYKKFEKAEERDKYGRIKFHKQDHFYKAITLEL